MVRTIRDFSSLYKGKCMKMIGRIKILSRMRSDYHERLVKLNLTISENGRIDRSELFNFFIYCTDADIIN